MPRGFPPLFRAAGRAAPSALALAILALALAGVAAADEGLAAAQRELALWVDSLATALPAGNIPATSFPQAAAWLAAAGGEGDAEFARALCRPRYAALAGHGNALAQRLAAADGAGALAVYRGRILPTCLEIAVCLSVAGPHEVGR